MKTHPAELLSRGRFLSDSIVSETRLSKNTPGHSEFANYHHGVNPKHSKGIIENIPDRPDFLRGIHNQPRQGTIGIEIVNVDRGVANPVSKRWDIARKFQRSSRSHCVSNEAFGVVKMDSFSLLEDFSQSFALLGISARGSRRMSADNLYITCVESTPFEG
jgi:hypothetical protein